MKRTIAVAAAVALPLMVAGCTPTVSETAPTGATVPSSTPSATPMDQMLPPTTVVPADLDGTDVRVIRGTSLVLAVPDGTEAEWMGTTADVAIAEFSPGGPSEGAVFRPGFIVRDIGTTDATVTGPDGRTVAFTITVVEY
ncbi:MULTISPECIES: hypothetical protein [Microbacterium]|uniref:hypothetical protein n=1 Tax=Microbacterium TaxID=33882 RepID=UPI00277D99FF|nr:MULTISPECIES: hypothetical protein [Microbacterium]MDQ1083955.1 hypothetical protein [Microbacterium sp. SORGH_AS_0344]MDQ1170766.1 hypothetical protein [Microbacterium proteolyticum]